MRVLEHPIPTMEQINDFFKDLWKVVITKHNEGVYNTVCLLVLLTLPLVVLIIFLLVCCHCCCCYCCDGCKCCHRGDSITASQAESKKKKKRNGKQMEEDLWISVKMDPSARERVSHTAV